MNGTASVHTNAGVRSNTNRRNMSKSGARAYTAPKEPNPIVYVYPTRDNSERLYWKKSEKRAQVRRAYNMYSENRERAYGRLYEKKHSFNPQEDIRRAREYSDDIRSGTKAAPRPKRTKIVIENIIDLFGSVADKGRMQYESVFRSAVLNKKFVEFRKGLFRTFIVALALILSFVLIYNFLFEVRAIEPEESSIYSADEIRQASGIELGEKLYSFRADTVENRITFNLPYIKSAELTRSIPDKIMLTVTEDTGVYYTDVYGTKLVLSSGLRVLGEYNAERDTGLVELLLPEISYSVAGRVIRFENEGDDRYIRNVLSSLSESSLYGALNMVDLRSEYAINAFCDGIFYLKFGGDSDLDIKIRMAEKAVGNMLKDSYPAQINLSISGEASVIVDATIRYTAD